MRRRSRYFYVGQSFGHLIHEHAQDIPVAPMFFQWRESLRMTRLVLRRISVFALALTMVLPLRFRAQANVTCAHAVVGADCCGANCPLPARHMLRDRSVRFLDCRSVLPELRAKQIPLAIRYRSHEQMGFLSPSLGRPREQNYPPGCRQFQFHMDRLCSLPL